MCDITVSNRYYGYLQSVNSDVDSSLMNHQLYIDNDEVWIDEYYSLNDDLNWSSIKWSSFILKMKKCVF